MSDKPERWDSSDAQARGSALLREVGVAAVKESDDTGEQMRESNATAQTLIEELSSRRAILLAAVLPDAKLPRLLVEVARVWRAEESEEGARLRIAHDALRDSHARAGNTANRVRGHAQLLANATTNANESLRRSGDLERATFDRVADATTLITECRGDIHAMEAILRSVSR